MDIFCRVYDDPEAVVGVVPDSTAIYNYCKNIIIKTKMEREVAIVCLAYVERLTLMTGLRINEVNWKRLLFICLILASKIWDDESFENIHFAKTIPKYSLREISEMESTFLQLIDFSLTLQQADYAKYYFILRTFAKSKERSFQLNALDV